MKPGRYDVAVAVLILLLVCISVVVLYQRLGRISGPRGIGPNFAVKLENGYQLWVTSSDCAFISDEGGAFVLWPHVKRLNTKEALVFGLVYERGKIEKGVFEEGKKKGYFILDTSTGHLVENLQKDGWLEKLKTYGLEDEPKLLHPSFFFNLFRGR